MSALSSPARFSSDYDGYYDPNFTVDISNKMRVPRRIRVGGSDDEVETNNFVRSTTDPAKLEMTVPGRILVTGQDTHLGLKSPPRELHLEQSMLQSQPSIRVHTPPRVLTLEDHPFPAVDEPEPEIHSARSTGSELAQSSHNTSNTAMEQSLNMSYPSTPPLNNVAGDGLVSPAEELFLFRRHLAKLSRRVMVLEHENHQRQQREVIIYSFGVAYFLLKTLLWLHRHW